MTHTTPTLLVGPYESARSGLSPPQPGQAPVDDDSPRTGAPDGELWSPDRVLPADELVQTIAVLDAQVAALRARLSAVEEVVGLPVQPRRPAPPTLLELRRRLATLERRAGIVPGLDPLPGLAPADPPEPDLPASAAHGHAAWLARGREAAVVAVVLAVVALLARPTGERPPAPVVTVTTTAVPAGTPRRISAAPAPVVTPGPVLAPVGACAYGSADGVPGEGCAAGSSAASSPAAGATPWTGTCRSDVAGCVPDDGLATPTSPGGYRMSPPSDTQPGGAVGDTLATSTAARGVIQQDPDADALVTANATPPGVRRREGDPNELLPGPGMPARHGVPFEGWGPCSARSGCAR